MVWLSVLARRFFLNFFQLASRRIPIRDAFVFGSVVARACYVHDFLAYTSSRPSYILLPIELIFRAQFDFDDWDHNLRLPS